MGTKTIGIRDDVYERLRAHKRGDESFSDTLDRLLAELDADWRTNVGFLSGSAAEEFAEEVERGLDALDESLDETGEGVDARLDEGSS